MMTLKSSDFENQLFYNKNKIIVRRSVFRDVLYLSENLRESDIQEMQASHNIFPGEALSQGFYDSIICLTVVNNYVPVAMFGINAKSFFSQDAVIWLLATPGLEKIQIRFLRHCKEFVNLMLSYYPMLYNFVDTRSTKTILWLKFLGAEIEEPVPYGFAQLPFHRFSFKRVP